MSRLKRPREYPDPAMKPGLDIAADASKCDVQSFVLSKFLQQQKLGLTKAEVARRLGWSRQRVHQLLMEPPRNFEIGTIARLLYAICGERFLPSSRPTAGWSIDDVDRKNWRDLRERGMDAAGFKGLKEGDLQNAAPEIEITLYRPITAQPLVADKK
jgi:hypothetical protein